MLSKQSDHNLLTQAIKKEVRRRLRGESTGHDYWHCKRVVTMALRIGKEEGANLHVLEYAGWLHDIGVKKGRKNHETRSAQKAEVLLTKHHVEKQLIHQVVHCIRNHRYTTGHAETLEDNILQDADKLDVMGAIGIGRIFAYAGKHKVLFHDGKTIGDPIQYKKTGHSRTIISHYYDKLQFLPDLLHTKTAKDIGKKRIQYIHEFIKQFLDEWEGK